MFVVNAMEDISREELVDKANAELIERGKIDFDYFGREYSEEEKYKLSKNKYLVGMRNLIVYGEPHGDFNNDRYRELGFSMDNTEVSNYLYPNIPSIVPLYTKNWIREPWHNEDVLKRTWGIKYVKGSTYMFNDDKDYNKSIKLGLREVYNEEDFPDEFLNREDLYKFVHVYQPPTSWSWGFGVTFHNNGNNYMTVPMSPEGLKGDLSVDFEELPSSAVPRDKVQVLVQIKSSFKTNLTEIDGNAPLFKWEITDKTSNTPIPSVKYYGYVESDTGNVELSANGETIFLAEFEMPENDVNIKFEINKDGTKPSEMFLDNNILETVITPAIGIDTFGDFNLDYNILSKKVRFPLVNGVDIIARLSAPRGYLFGNAWGALNIYNESNNLFRGFQNKVLAVDELAGLIVKNPIINTTIHRKDATYDSSNLYDNPLESKWFDGPSSKKASGKITFGGRAYGNYEYTVTRTKEDGTTYTESRSSTTSAAFNSGTDTRTITTKIYNGKSSIPAKTFENKIDFNTTNYLQKNLFWTSEPYKFNVVRWMCHEDEDDSLYGWTTVPGRYQRTFTQQNSGILKWTTASTMKNDYKKSREAARNKDYRKSEYDKAVFASDIDFKYVDYPIKSGYYFNPTGTYTFDVETVTYKTNINETKDHKDLVAAVIDSFRYESDLMYINSYQEPVNLQNQSLPKSGNNYARRAASLTAKDPTGVDGVEMLNVEIEDYTKDFEELEHSEKSGEYTHEYLEAILEGYDESGTIGSANNYKYREYIKDGQKIYRITEKTTVTIKINTDNKKVYTYVNMPDGKYTVKAWIGDIPLSGTSNEYKKLGTLKGISALDVIEVSVKGSMFEDTN